MDLDIIHNKLSFKHGSLLDELPEQMMSLKFIESTDTVLELGGNIGRNSCIISFILDDSSRLLVFEPNKNHYIKLCENRDINNFKFNIENCAISKTELYQDNTDFLKAKYDINFIEYHWKKANISSWTNIKNKYSHLSFNVLVADCEGGLYYILKEEPNFLDTINTIIIENDFIDMSHFQYVQEHFKKIIFLLFIINH